LLAGIAGRSASCALFRWQIPSRPTSWIGGGIAGGTDDILAIGITEFTMALGHHATGIESHCGGAAPLYELRLGVLIGEAVLPMSVHHPVDAMCDRCVVQ